MHQQFEKHLADTQNSPSKEELEKHNMEPRPFWCLSLISAWMFVFFLSSLCSGLETTEMSLESRVFVAFAGEDLNIGCKLKMPPNQTSDTLTCWDPFHAQIYNCDIPATASEPRDFNATLELKNLKNSGEYSCQYKTAKVYWFLQVRDGGYKEPSMLDRTEVITVAILTGGLLVISVVGSVYVFRGHWREHNTESFQTSRKRKQNREERKETQTEEDNVDAITSQSTSFYASLEARPRSIYDVLDHSAAKREPKETSKAKPKEKESQKMVVQTIQPQNEDVFESVYENF